MNRDVKLLLRDRDSAFCSGNMELYSAARSNLKLGIKEAKAAYWRKIEGHFSKRDVRCVWQGIQQITNFRRSKDQDTGTSSNLAEELNHYFTRYEVRRSETDMIPPPPTDALTLSVSTEEVRRVFRKVNPAQTSWERLSPYP